MHSFGEAQSMALNLFSAYASMAASAMLFRSIANDMLPKPVKAFLYSILGRFFKYLMGRFFTNIPNRMTMVVDEHCGGFTRNQIYDAAEIYLGSKINLDSERLKVIKGPKQKSISLSMDKGQEVIDWYRDTTLKLKWKFHLLEPDQERAGRGGKDKRHFELTFDRNHREVVLNEYLPFVLARAREIKENERGIKLFTRDCPFQDKDDDGRKGGVWGSINLDHPITFDKLAMDRKLKQTIIEDLDMFVRRKDYYKQVGKAWKRGYLLYGPPGTGKSSLVAAMANRLQFDVYDLQLSSVRSDSDLRRIIFSTNNKSIIVVEDIDCSSPTHQRSSGNKEKKTNNYTELTLSGLLNFIDGLWSSCGDERIIVFTTNHREKLDPALLRPGRMDMHIHMGYCTPEGFDVLAWNYFGVQPQDLPEFFPRIKELIGRVKVTPAELAEHLMRSEKVEIALKGVIELLKQKEEEELQQGQGGHKEMQEQDREMKRSETAAGKKSTEYGRGNRNGEESIKASSKSGRKKSGRLGKILTGLRKSKNQS